MSDAYIEQRDDAYMVAGTGVSLDSIVYAFLSGQSAEAIAQAFPVLRLEQVYGAITYYLAHRDDVDRYLIVSAVVRRVPTIDFRTATAAGLAGIKDEDVGKNGQIESPSCRSERSVPI